MSEVKDIIIGEDYIYTGGFSDVVVKVLAEDKNSTNDTIYACKEYGTGKLFWSNRCSLEAIAVQKYTHLQEAFINSEKQHINLIACGKGAGTTTAFFENIINILDNGVPKFIYYGNYKVAKAGYEQFIRFCLDKGLKFNIDHINHVVIFPNLTMVYFINGVGFLDRKGDHYYESGWEKFYNSTVSPNKGSKYYFSCLPSDIVSGYSTTTDKGYYEVKSCKHPLLKYLIDDTGKIPKATPNKIEQFLAAETNLITGYNAYDNSFLPEEFADTIKDLPYSEERRLSGSWAKL